MMGDPEPGFASGTVSGRLFPLSLQPAGDHFSTDAPARERNPYCEDPEFGTRKSTGEHLQEGDYDF